MGLSSKDVTGSSHLITYKGQQVLLECGMYQCKDKIKQYTTNNRNFDFKPKELTSVILLHFHMDHYGLLPRLYQDGCTAPIYTTVGGKEYLKIAFEDSLKIMEKDLEYISKVTNKVAKPIYIKEFVDITLDKIVEVDFNTMFQINEYMSINLLHSYHVLNSAHLELYVKDKKANYQRKLYYTSDIGNIGIKDKSFLEKFQGVIQADSAILETTYAQSDPNAIKVHRKDDMGATRGIIDSIRYDDNNNGNVIIASFAFHRMQELILCIYDMYGKDKKFDMDVIVDSPLGVKITEYFVKFANKKDSAKLQKAINWSNLHLVSDWQDSEKYRNDGKSKIVIAASGFMESGRIISWLKSCLPNKDTYFVFVGYSSPDSLASKIKSKKYDRIKINGEEYDNKANILNLLSFSSHIQHNDMLKYYSDMNVRNVYLVHGNLNRRIEFKKTLETEYRRKNKSTKVWIGDYNLEVDM